jgi:hypothetical protein
VFVPIAPCRLFDTRPLPDNVGGRATPIGRGETFTVQATGPQGKCNLPVDATAVAMNVSVTGGSAPSFLTVFPGGTTLPLAANLTWVANQPPTPNKVDVGLSDAGRVSFYNFAGTVNVVADVDGYYADHNFDDRYYTKAQVDSALASKATKPASGRLVVTSDEMQPSISTNISVARTAYNLVGSGNGSPLCLAAPVRLPAGAQVTKVSVRGFFTDYHSDLNAGLIRRRFDDVQAVASETMAVIDVPAPSVFGFTPGYEVGIATTILDPTIDSSSGYLFGVCTVDGSQLFSLAAIDYIVP